MFDGEGRASSKTDNGTTHDVRFREGTELTDYRGRFAVTGDRITFYAKRSTVQLRSLENLALERVVRVMGDSNDPSKIEWSVQGRVTEYQGENYLMIERAVVETESADAGGY